MQTTRFVASHILSVAGNSTRNTPLTPNVQERGVVVYHCSVLFACYLFVYRSSSVYFSFCLFIEIVNENRLVYGFVSDMFLNFFITVHCYVDFNNVT
jgi:hypothetical protein